MTPDITVVVLVTSTEAEIERKRANIINGMSKRKIWASIHDTLRRRRWSGEQNCRQ